MPNFQNLVGQQFGRLFVVSRAENSRNKDTQWFCYCECGTKKIVHARDLKNGKTTSCGCFKRECAVLNATSHGKRFTRAYASWRAMRSRCNNPNVIGYKDYGGRGINVCARWRKFENFYADMGDPPPGMSLHRIDNDDNYSKANCKWATSKEQARNKSRNRLLEFNGRVQPIISWAEETGIPYARLHQRIHKLGWTAARALSV